LSGQISNERKKSLSALNEYQSLLFVPGNRPERFNKALASGADLVCIDLEDAVGPADKDAARASALGAMGNPRLGIRVNGLRTRQGLADLVAISASAIKPAFVMIPMVEAVAEIEIAHAVLGAQVPLLPLIETVRGLGAARAVAAAAGIGGVMLGGADFAGELGVTLSWEPLIAARAEIVMACASAKVPAIDVPWLDLDNLDGLAGEVTRIKAIGFAAKSAVHPKHVAVIHQIMRPTAEQIAEAHEAEAAYAAAGQSAVRFKNTMLEAPVMARYRRVLALEGKANA
jgi:(S)-citramalyl-CoA lyase